MKKDKSKRGISCGLTTELVFAILIAICIIGNTFIYHTINDYQINRYDSTLFVPHEYINQNNEELEEMIREYHPDPSRMIEIYNTNFDLQSRIIIDENPDAVYNNIKDYPDLIKYFIDNKEGHAYYLNNDNTETDFYFTWYITKGASGGEQIVLIFMSRPRGIDNQIHDILSYIMLGLTFGIILSIFYKQNKRNRKLMNSYNKMDESMMQL